VLHTPKRYRIAISPSKLALGAGRLGAFWQGNSLPESIRTLQTALDRGINVIDTADVYALGLSERVIGALLRARRSQTLLCTKAGQLKTPQSTLMAHKLESRLSLYSLRDAIPRRTPANASQVPRCFTSRYLQYAVRRSLKRLRTGRIDVLLLHSPTAEDLLAQRFEAAAQRLLWSGDIAHFGVSCDNQQVAELAAAIPYVSFIELPMDCARFTNAQNQALVSRLANRGVGVLARSPFAGGALAQTIARELGVFSTEAAACCLQSITDLEGVFTTIVGMSSAARVCTNLALLSEGVTPDTRARVARALHGSTPSTVTSFEEAST
jgi:aryl-alcohol dehydrogenase-like predicted oxidoreductase